MGGVATPERIAILAWSELTIKDDGSPLDAARNASPIISLSQTRASAPDAHNSQTAMKIGKKDRIPSSAHTKKKKRT
jgi:hypothetical protein